MQNLTAAPLAGVAWIEGGQRAEFASTSGEYGVRNAAGEWLSFDGVRPYCPRGGRRAAAEVAATVSGVLQWVRSI